MDGKDLTVFVNCDATESAWGVLKNATCKKISTKALRPTNFESLPYEILVEIFKYLSFKEVKRSGRVCKKWHEATKDPHFSKQVVATVRGAHEALKLVLQLPANVISLRICCSSLDVRFPVWLPDITSTLRRRCPNLKTLILEKVFFQAKFCDALITTYGDMRLVRGSRCPLVETRGTEEDRQSASCNYCTGEVNEDQFAPEKLPKMLRVLSLRDCLFITSNFASRLDVPIPQIKVLDLSPSLCITEDIVQFFSRLTHLRELYLVGCPVTSGGIESLLKTLPHLRVLDLENTGVGKKTFLALKQHGRSLRELYLGGTLVDDTFMVFEDEDTFKNLLVLCLRSTCITARGLVELLTLYSSLKTVNVSHCQINEALTHGYMREKLVFDRPSQCDHFKENGHRK